MIGDMLERMAQAEMDFIGTFTVHGLEFTAVIQPEGPHRRLIPEPGTPGIPKVEDIHVRISGPYVSAVYKKNEADPPEEVSAQFGIE